MRIALDARTIFAPQRRGIAKSLLQLYSHLARIRPDWQIIAYHRSPNPDTSLLPGRVTELRLVEMPGDRFDAWLRWRLPAAAWGDQADLLHCPANHCPHWMALPTVVTIHDLIPLDDPANFPAAVVKRFRKSVRYAASRAAAVFCPSAYTRDRLIGQFHLERRRAIANPWAIDDAYRQAPARNLVEDQPILDRYGIDRPYVLHFGSGEARKNTRRLLEAWSQLQQVADINNKLLVVGFDPTTQQELTQYAFALDIADSVFLHGFVAEAELPTLLAGAEVLAYPNQSEGFGLPILEAFATNTAVLCGNATSLPEVAGEAAMLVDPHDVGAIALGLGRLMLEEELRGELIRRGHEKLTQYTWEACAKRLALTLEIVVQQNHKRRAA